MQLPLCLHLNTVGTQGTIKSTFIEDVKATGAKPWSQKGTGRARAGSYASPIWRSGGVTFASQPKDYNVKVNKKWKNKTTYQKTNKLFLIL